MQVNNLPPFFKPSNPEEQKAMVEALQLHDPSTLDHPALQRCAVEAPIDSDTKAKQAYDRMYHTHNRS